MEKRRSQIQKELQAQSTSKHTPVEAASGNEEIRHPLGKESLDMQLLLRAEIDNREYKIAIKDCVGDDASGGTEHIKEVPTANNPGPRQ